jgi:hypothetical protein
MRRVAARSLRDDRAGSGDLTDADDARERRELIAPLVVGQT